jgi:hypothetical protein
LRGDAVSDGSLNLPREPRGVRVVVLERRRLSRLPPLAELARGLSAARSAGRRAGSSRTGATSARRATCARALPAGTIFDLTRLPLTLWFHAAWLVATNKDGISAMALKRQLELHSYQTARTMLAKFRVVTAHSERTRLSGDVEMDETLFGGDTPRQCGRARGAKLLVANAVERTPTGFGRCRMGVLDSAHHRHLPPFIRENIEPGSDHPCRRLEALRDRPALLGLPARGHGRSGHESRGRPAGGPPGGVALQALGTRNAPGQHRMGPRASLPRRSFEVA